MQADKYSRVLIAVCVAFAVVFFVGALLLLGSGPRVRFVNVADQLTDNAFNRSSTIVINFDRPIERRDYTESISISPAVEFTTETAPQAITVRLAEHLAHDQEYQLTVEPDIVDTTGRMMDSAHETTFESKTPAVAYIERNYDGDNTSGNDLQDDRLIRQTLGDNSEVIFTHPQIVDFAASNEFFFISVREDQLDTIVVLDRDSGARQEFEPIIPGQVGNLAIAPGSSVLLYAVNLDSTSVSDEYFAEFDSTLLSLDIETGEQQTLIDDQGENLQAISVRTGEDSQVALLQRPDQTFVAVSPFGNFDPVLLGSHTASYGFDEQVSSILFRDNVLFSIYDIQNAELSPISLPIDGFVQNIIYRNEETYVDLLTEAPFELQEYEVRRLGDASVPSETELIWSTLGREEVRLRNLSVSHDGRYFALHLNPSDCQFDQLFPNNECTVPTTVVYDSETEEEIFEVSGFDMAWLP